MKNQSKFLFLIALLNIFSINCYPQKIMSIEECIKIAQNNSYKAQESKNKYLQSTYQYKIHKKSYLPSLSLSGNLPSFNRSISKISMPNGDEAFVAQSTGNYTGTLSLNQPIPFVGGDFFVSSGLQRLDIYNDSVTTSYLANIVNLGLRKSIFGYNSYKWDAKIEPLHFFESQQVYNEEMEDIARDVIELYFNVLIAQENLRIQSYNKLNLDTIYYILKEKYIVGTCTEDEVIQVEVNLLNCELQILQLQNEIDNKKRKLFDFLNQSSYDSDKLIKPTPIYLGIIDVSKAIKESFENGSAELNHKRKILEAQSNLSKVKAENSISVDLYASLGLSKNDGNLRNTFINPLDQEVVTLSIKIPIFDFGIRKYKLKQSELSVSNVILGTEREKQDNLIEIEGIVNQIKVIQNNNDVVVKTKELADKRFYLAKKRFENGKINFMEYSNAQLEKDKSELDYLQLLKKRWELYYELRKGTLYDYLLDKKISHL